MWGIVLVHSYVLSNSLNVQSSDSEINRNRCYLRWAISALLVCGVKYVQSLSTPNDQLPRGQIQYQDTRAAQVTQLRPSILLSILHSASLCYFSLLCYLPLPEFDHIFSVPSILTNSGDCMIFVPRVCFFFARGDVGICSQTFWLIVCICPCKGSRQNSFLHFAQELSIEARQYLSGSDVIPKNRIESAFNRIRYVWSVH